MLRDEDLVIQKLPIYYKLMFLFQQYLTTRKVEVKTTKNTEKRVQRQVVLHDGRVIARTEPEIVTDTVEDFTTHEEEHGNDIFETNH